MALKSDIVAFHKIVYRFYDQDLFEHMYIIGYFLMAVAKVLDIVLIAFMWIVIIRAVLSWVNPDPFNPIVRFIHNITEPILYSIRTRIPVNFGGIDFSPILVFIGIVFLRTFLVNSLKTMALSLV